MEYYKNVDVETAVMAAEMIKMQVVLGTEIWTCCATLGKLVRTRDVCAEAAFASQIAQSEDR